MLGSIPHQKFYFYHLPTRGRAGIKLGDAWYVSNVSIIVDCSMLLYYLFWMITGFILHFYIIFGTNLLTGGPVPVSVFLPIFVFRRKGIPNGVQTEWNLCDDLSWTATIQKTWSQSLELHEVATRQEGVPPPSWAPHSSTDVLFRLYILLYPRNIKGSHETTFPPPQPSVPVRSHLGAFCGASSEGESIMEGFYINTIASPMKRE